VNTAQRLAECRALVRAEPGKRHLGDPSHLGVDDLLKPAAFVSEHQPDQSPVAEVRLAPQQAGRFHPAGRPGHRRRGQPEFAGDLTGGQPVFPPQAAQHELLALVDSVPGERGDGGVGQCALSPEEGGLEVRLPGGVVAGCLWHGTPSVRRRKPG
jgi:hypothetical protein